MSQEQSEPVLAYERRFVPALAWAVRGAMLQFGGRMAIVEDDGSVVYDVRGSNGLIFVAIVLGVLTVITLVGPMAIEIAGASWFPRKYHFFSTLIGAVLLAAATACYVRAMATFRITLLAAGERVAHLSRGDSLMSTRPIWYVTDADEAVVGRVQSADGELQIVDALGWVIVEVEATSIPGIHQAIWRRIRRRGSTARGRLRIGMGAGARLEIDDAEFDVDPRLLAALLLSVAVEGK